MAGQASGTGSVICTCDISMDGERARPLKLQHVKCGVLWNSLCSSGWPQSHRDPPVPASFLFVCLLVSFSKEKEKEKAGMKEGGRVGEVKRLWRSRGRETVIRIYCMKKITSSRLSSAT